MGIITDLLGRVVETASKQIVTDLSFSRGKEGKPPVAFNNPENKKIAEEAYEKGQTAAFIRMGNRVVDKITDD
jgi:hypothetical protein